MIDKIINDKKNKYLLKKKNEEDEYQKYLEKNINTSDNEFDLNPDNIDEYNEKNFIMKSSDNSKVHDQIISLSTPYEEEYMNCGKITEVNVYHIEHYKL